MIQIKADDRELKSGVIEALEKIKGVEVVVERLPLGDYEVDHRLIFERKRLQDFSTSIIDGRLFRQARRLTDSELQGVILIEGPSSDLESSGMRREAIQGALISLTLLYRLPVLRSLNPEESSRLMVYTAKQIHIDTNQIRSFRKKRPKTKRKQQLYFLQGLPLVGPKRAQDLLNHFGSIEKVITASPETLCCVDGIGMGTAEAINQMVRQNRVPYFIDPY